ncbi:MAG: 7-cyano-7-deazaguanine synthase QueC [Candidatus Helarchaeota archaeon]
MTRAIVVLSGGMDSTTVAGILHAKGYEIYGITVDYLQRTSKKELDCAKKVGEFYGFKDHLFINLSFMKEILKDSTSLIDEKLEIPTESSEDEIPNTYVPFRNTIILSLAVAWAETLNAELIGIGVNALDYSGYPDCRPEYIEAFEKVARLGTKPNYAPQIFTPLQHMSKAEIVKKAVELGVPLDLTWSCYQNQEKACGTCESCQLRIKGFKEAGVTDPIPYEST